MTLHVGVLALQGDYAAHERAVAALGHRVRQVKTAAPLESIDALLLPGGESTTMLRFLQDEDLLEPVAGFCRSGRPVLGTCAGAILLSTDVTAPRQASLGLVDMTIERNAYGRQVDSFIARLHDAAPEAAALAGIEAVFIRAPVIRRTGPCVAVLLRHEGAPVLVRQGSIFAATFHPELTDDTRVLALALQGAA